MDYVTLGRTGLKVSRLCLGCMTYGTPGAGPQPWSLSEEAAKPFFRHAWEMGVTFYDTANMYSHGASEEITGRALKALARREEVVIASKVGLPAREGRYAAGLSRKAILFELDESLRRLGTEYIDLYQIHRWDYATPIEETMQALHDVVRAGKVRYLGASSMFAWQFAKANAIARLEGWTPFVSMQNHLNLLYREEEREMLPLCQDQGVGVMPWAPLARGRLARPWSAAAATEREAQDRMSRALYDATQEADRAVIDAVGAVAEARGAPRAQVALAWVLQKAPVSAAIVGATRLAHLDDALAAQTLALTPDEIASLEAPYVPHAVVAHV